MKEVKLFHNKWETWKERKIGDRAYIFTNWGLVLGTIVKTRIDKNTGIPQYKFDICIDKINTNVEHGFWYCADQMSRTKFTAVMHELIRPIKVKFIKEKVK